MPVIKQAAKKLRHDRRRAAQNAAVRKTLRDVVKKMRSTPTKKQLELAYKTLDKAAKTRSIHPNKAARLKSRLSKLLKK